MTGLLRWATAGCIGAVALAVVLVALQPSSVAQRETRRSLEQSGVRVVEPATNSGDAFEDPGSALSLALASLAFGIVAGIALGAATQRFGHLVLLAVAGFGIAAIVLAIADRATWRDLGTQAAFWSTTTGWLWWSGRDRQLRGAARPRP